LDVKFTVGQAHQIAKVFKQQAKPKPTQEARTLAYIELFEAGRCKLTPAECRELEKFMRSVCNPTTPAQQTEFASIVKRLTPAS
jgi:hypothetical protein